jgi:hypothetical protein
MRYVPLTQGKVAIVDNADYKWLMQWKWYAYKSPHSLYAGRMAPTVSGVRSFIRMHNEISGYKYTDHADRDGLNNCRSNLRSSTKEESQRNRGLFKNSMSGYKGVTYQNRQHKWQARIWLGKSVSLWYFLDPQEAALAYDNAAVKYFGEFACTNQTIGLLE